MRHIGGYMDQEAFIKAFESYADPLFRYCYFRVFDRERARELVQETFTRTWEEVSNGKDIKNLRAFLYRVARNLIIDESRKRKTSSLEKLREEEGFEPSFNDVPQKEAALDASHALDKLSQLDDKYQSVLLMRYVEEYSIKEIAQNLNESTNVVSVRIYRGLKQLRKLIDKEANST